SSSAYHSLLAFPCPCSPTHRTPHSFPTRRSSDLITAGPPPGRAASPTIAVPVVAKIPAPIVAPTPSAVRCHLPRVRLRPPRWARSEEHTSELQSLAYLVCRLLLEKKKKITFAIIG